MCLGGGGGGRLGMARLGVDKILLGTGSHRLVCGGGRLGMARLGVEVGEME